MGAVAGLDMGSAGVASTGYVERLRHPAISNKLS